MSPTDHAKVSQLDPAAGRVAQEDVLWFEVPVDETEGMQMGQGPAELGHHPLAGVLLHTNLGMEDGGEVISDKRAVGHQVNNFPDLYLPS